jgi:hypothetical protein
LTRSCSELSLSLSQGGGLVSGATRELGPLDGLPVRLPHYRRVILVLMLTGRAPLRQ